MVWEFLRKDRELDKIDRLSDSLTAVIISLNDIKNISIANQNKIDEMHPIVMELQDKYELLKNKFTSENIVKLDLQEKKDKNVYY